MDKKRKLVLISAVILGLVAVFLVNFYLQGMNQKQPAIRKPPQPTSEEVPTRETKTAEVLVARTNIPRGASLEEKMFAKGRAPIEFIQPQAVSSFEEIEGKIALVPISKGEQLLLNKTGSYGEERRLTFSMKVPQGKRAITIIVDRIAAAGGMMKAGDYVDVFCNFPFTQTAEGQPVQSIITVPLFQKVLVLDVEGLGTNGTKVRKSTTATTDVSVTLALSPEETGLLLFAKEQGQVYFVLRAPLDTEVKQLAPISINTLIQQIAPGPSYGPPQGEPDMPTQQTPQVEQKKQQGVEVFKGIEREK